MPSLFVGFLFVFLVIGCKKKPEIPVLTTQNVTEITVHSALSGGNITSNGGAEVTERGVCWSKTPYPVSSGSHTSDGKGTGSFTSDVTGLEPNTDYYLRAYATNNVGTAYGNEITFKTNPVITATITTVAVSSVTSTTAVSGGNITSDGGGTITARGVCWSTAANPTTTNDKTTDGTGTGTFASNLTGLLPGTTYHIRAYAINSAGVAYGNDLTFTTTSVSATLTTAAVTNITSSTAVSGGNITSDGGAAVTARGVCWSTSVNPTISDSKTTDGSGRGVFTSNITGLQPVTTYHVRAYATNSVGTSYGDDITFTTLAGLPVVTTNTLSSITQTSATSGGNVTSNGGAVVTERGVCWGTTSGPTISGTHVASGSGNGTFTCNITGLTPGTTYYVRAYATNSVGTAYGNERTFTTTAVSLPVLTTAAVTAIGTTTATSGGSITSAGGGTITAKGVCWGMSSSPTVSGPHTTDGTGTGSFVSSLTGLTPGTVYYVRAYATNSAGIAYGNELKFSSSVADIEGNVYRTIEIGNQLWMAEDLKSMKFNDNSVISNITNNSVWSTTTDPAYCWYDNDPDTYRSSFGAIYNWFAVGTGKLCPSGWHVPSHNDFKILETYLGMTSDQVNAWDWRGTDQGTKMKSTSTWIDGGNGSNSSGFSALGGGYRYGGNGEFYDFGKVGYWWTSDQNSSTDALYRRLDYNSTQVYAQGVRKQGGKFVRCLKY